MAVLDNRRAAAGRDGCGLHDVASAMKVVAQSQGNAGAPYRARPSCGDDTWWYVEDKNGVNVISVIVDGRQTGQKFVDKFAAESLARWWNDGCK